MKRKLKFECVSVFRSLPGLPKDFVPKDPKLLLPKDFQPNKEFHPKIGHEDEDEDDDHGDGEEGDDDVDHPNSFPSMPGSLPRTNVGHGKHLHRFIHLTFLTEGLWFLITKSDKTIEIALSCLFNFNFTS